MNPEGNNQSNPEIGMSEDSFESAQSANSGSEEFFETLDHQVNGGIIDSPEATQTQPSSTEQATYENVETGSNTSGTQSQDGTDWEKRYTDSSREAVKWRDKYNQVEQFVPVLEAMKNDSGLVDHVRNYLVEGGKPAKSIQEKLNLDENFMFDQHEAMTNPDSDSAKLMNAHVDTMVQQRVGEVATAEKQRAIQFQLKKNKETEMTAFQKKMNMSDEDFTNFKDRASKHVLSMDDIHYLLNKDKAASNVAQSTKKDMLNQMKNIRNMPTSASGANNQGSKDNNPDRDVFNNILGFDNGTDNLFG